MKNLKKAWKKYLQTCAKCDRLQAVAEAYMKKHEKAIAEAADLHTEAFNEYADAVESIHGKKAKINWENGEVESPIALRLLKSMLS